MSRYCKLLSSWWCDERVVNAHGLRTALPLLQWHSISCNCIVCIQPYLSFLFLILAVSLRWAMYSQIRTESTCLVCTGPGTGRQELQKFMFKCRGRDISLLVSCQDTANWWWCDGCKNRWTCRECTRTPRRTAFNSMTFHFIQLHRLYSALFEFFVFNSGSLFTLGVVLCLSGKDGLNNIVR